jgi:ATP-dependent RNA helicase DeaD
MASSPTTTTTHETFRDLGLSEPLVRAIDDVGFEEPTPIQIQAIPVLLAGKDLIAQAQTGTGKTAAFALPILQRLKPEGKRPQALVLTPTRELAIQVAQTFPQLGKHVDAHVLAVYGGQPIQRQLRALQHPLDIVVGTPGRIMDHLRRETLTLEAVTTVVIDEADEMLHMGFIEDIEWILDLVPAKRQTALFSATIPARIAQLAKRYLNDPVQVTINMQQVTAPLIEHFAYEVAPHAKAEVLARILDLETPASAIIFCRTKRMVDDLTTRLQTQGYSAEALHGDLNQMARDRVMARFRSGQAELLVATDVAARGLDIPEVSHVINFDIPTEPQSYVHRIGRTGRAGRTGKAITLMSRRERQMLGIIERVSRQKIERRYTPSREDIMRRQIETLGASLTDVIEQDGSLEMAKLILADLATYFQPEEIAAAAIKLLMQGRGIEEEPASLIDADRAEDGMVRLYLNLGRDDKIRPTDVVGAIAGEADIPGKSIGQIEIYDRWTYVDVPSRDAERVVNALSTARLRGKPVKAEIARPSASRERARR